MKKIKSFILLVLLCPLLLLTLNGCAPDAYTKISNHIKTKDWFIMTEKILNDNTHYKTMISISDYKGYSAAISSTYRTDDNYNFIVDIRDVKIEDNCTNNEFKVNVSYDNLQFKDICMRSDWYIQTEHKKVQDIRCLDVWKGTLNLEEKAKIELAIRRLIDDTVNYFILNDLPTIIV